VERKTAVAVSGDGRDWAALYQVASGITHRLLRNPSDAEDAAQEAILRAYRAITAGTTPTDMHAWLATIAKREAFRLHGRVRPTSSLDEPSVSEPEQTPDPIEVTLDRLTADQLLRDVDLETRELLLRRFALGQASSEIGTAMHMPASTVRVKLHRSLGQIRRSREAASPLP
jgi:RNA polymerase sigma-70 factor (ECF subfamily)